MFLKLGPDEIEYDSKPDPWEFNSLQVQREVRTSRFYVLVPFNTR